MTRHSREIWSWAFYDFGNSAYSLIMLSFVFPIFFRDVIVGSATGDFWWGLITSVSILLGGLAAPFVGALADVSVHRRKKFVFFALVSMICTGLLFFSGPGTIVYAALLFVFANAAFEIAITLYDSYLPLIARPSQVSHVSGLGWGLGYLGGIVGMLVLFPLYSGGIESANGWVRWTFVGTALFFFVFALPSFANLPVSGGRIRSVTTSLKVAAKQVWSTLCSARKYKHIGVFLAALYFLNDGLVTVFAFVPIYASSTFGFSVVQIGLLVLFAQGIAAPSTMIIGRLADRYGKKRVQLLTVAGWLVVLGVLITTTSVLALYVATALAGVVMGASQAVARAWLATLVPKGKESQFYGFNGFASKIAATTGPIVFGSVSVLSGSQRLAMLALAPFFVISFLLFWFVPERK